MRGLFAAALVPPLLATAACASTQAQDQAASPSQTVSAPSTPPAVVSASPHAAAAPCSTDELTISLGPGGVAAGTWAALLEFTNRGAACTMSGWPKVAGITAAGASTPATDRSGAMDGLDASGTPHVILQPGQQAGIDLSGADTGSGGSCPASYRQLRVSAPGDAASVTIPADLAATSGSLPSCGTLTVSPVHPLADFSFSGQ